MSIKFCKSNYTDCILLNYGDSADDNTPYTIEERIDTLDGPMETHIHTK